VFRVLDRPQEGDYETFRRWKIFADDSKELEVPERELRSRMTAVISMLPLDTSVRLRSSSPWSRWRSGESAAQQAKQVIVQKVREAERAPGRGCLRDRVGQLVSGVVKRVDRNGIYVDLGSNARVHPADRYDSARAR